MEMKWIFSIALTTLFASQSDTKALLNSSPYVSDYVEFVPTSSKLISYESATNRASCSSNSGYAGYRNAAVVSGGFGGDYFDNVGLNRGGNFITDEFNNGGGKHIAGGWVSNSGYDSQSTTNHQNQGFYNGGLMSSRYGSRVYAGRVYGGDYGVPGYGDQGYGEFPRDSWIEIPVGPKWSHFQTFSHY